MHILVVDDDLSTLRVLAKLLDINGHSVETCDQSVIALERLIAGSHQALLTDFVMPTMSGVELATRAAAVRPSLRCIVMSGHPAPNERPSFVEWISKPIDINALLSHLAAS